MVGRGQLASEIAGQRPIMAMGVTPAPAPHLLAWDGDLLPAAVRLRRGESDSSHLRMEAPAVEGSTPRPQLGHGAQAAAVSGAVRTLRATLWRGGAPGWFSPGIRSCAAGQWPPRADQPLQPRVADPADAEAHRPPTGGNPGDGPAASPLVAWGASGRRRPGVWIVLAAGLVGALLQLLLLLAALCGGRLGAFLLGCSPPFHFSIEDVTIQKDEAGNLHIDCVPRVATQHPGKIALEFVRTQVVWVAIEMLGYFPQVLAIGFDRPLSHSL